MTATILQIRGVSRRFDSTLALQEPQTSITDADYPLTVVRPRKAWLRRNAAADGPSDNACRRQQLQLTTVVQVRNAVAPR